MNERRRTYTHDGPRNLPPHLKNSLETEDEMMGLGPIGLCLGLATVILLVIAVLYMTSW